jgi:hypothetical protein
MRKLILLIVVLISSQLLMSQTTITTNHINNNGNGSITFNVQNTNATDIIITDVQCHLGTNAANNCQLLYNTSPIIDFAAPWGGGVVGAGQNGWILGGSAIVNSNTANGIVTAISGLNILVPAGLTYQFGFAANTIQYMTLTNGAGVNTFTSGGVNLLTGDGISWGGPIYPSTPANYPRGFVGGITFISGTACVGTPVPGNTSASANPACPSAPFNLSMVNAVFTSGLTYQWQSSPNGAAYTNIPGATSPTYSATQNANTYYQCVVTCTASGSSSTSTPLLVTTNSFLNCYCNSGATSLADEEIYNVTLSTLNNSSTCATTGGAGSLLNLYSNYTATVAAPILSPGTAYPLSIEIGSCGGNYNNMTKVFIDYNQNGLFTDAGEEVYVTPTFVNGPHIEVGSILLPPVLPSGLTRMRVVNVETTSAASISPCGTYLWGETEDYFVNISAPPTCPQPTALSLIQANLTSAQVQWVAGGGETQWEIEYGPQGFTLGTGTAVIVSTNPYTIAGLTANSFYQAYIRAICSPGDTSYWTPALAWNTYNQGQFLDWNSACPASGFIDISATGTPLNTLDDTNAGISLPWTWLVQGSLVNSISVGNNGGLILNTLNSFLYYNMQGNGFFPFVQDLNTPLDNVYWESVGNAPNRKLVIMWSDLAHYTWPVANDGATFEIIYEEATNEFYFVYDDVMMGNPAWDNGADAEIGVTTAQQSIQVSMDDPTYLAAHNCIHFYYTNCPSPQDFTLSYVVPTEASITWTAGIANETSWTVIYGPAGFDPTTAGTSIPAATASTIISGLTQLTQYDVYIYADCGVGLQSIGLFGTFMTPPYCSNPTAMFNSTAIDSIFTSWVWSQSSPSYPATSFNLQYGSLGFPLYSGTTLSVNNNLNDTITNPAFIAGEVVEIYVQAVCANDTSLFVGPFEVTMPLTNDTICGVDAIPVDGVVHIFNNTGATVDANEVGITPPTTGAQTTTGWANSTLNLTTWFSFVAPNSGDVRINCTNLPYNGQAAVYSGINCTGIANFNLIAANDDEINGNSLAPNFTICDLTPGQTYYLLHDAFTSTAGNYAISINEIVLNAGAQGPILSACSGDTINLFNGITGYDNGGVWTQQIPTLGLQDSLFITGGLAPILFSFTYTVSDGCANDDVPAKVDVFPPSSAGIDGTLTVCKNEPFYLTLGLSGVVDLGGTWYNPSNQAIGGAIDTASNIPGQFNYDYIVGNGVCPNDTANVLIIVDGSCDYEANILELMTGIKIYPNPTNDLLFINSTKNIKEINLLDLTGKLIQTKKEGLDFEFDMKLLETGVYIITIHLENEVLYKNIIKQ